MRAAAVFASITVANDVREAWLGLATARRRLGDTAGAAEALAAALRRHVPGPGIVALADAIALAAGAPGWCGLSSDGEPMVHPAPGLRAPVRIAAGHDGIRVATVDGRHLLGSPTDVAAINATVGCVETREGGLTGWAWHPGDSSVDPVLTIRPVKGRGGIRFTASDLDVRIEETGLLGRPRGFTMPAPRLEGMQGLLHVQGRDGKDLSGSPLDPRAERDASAAAATVLARLYPAARAPLPPPAPPPAMPVAATIPRLIGALSGAVRRPM